MSIRELQETARAAFAVSVWLILVAGSIASILWMVS
jgi:hypothetical protein